MSINKLELPDWKQTPTVDWSPLGRIGEAIAEQRRQARIRDAVEGARDGDGHVSLARLGENLAAAGEVEPGLRAMYLGARTAGIPRLPWAGARWAPGRGQNMAAEDAPVPDSNAPLPTGYAGAPAAPAVRAAMQAGILDPVLAARALAYGIHPLELGAPRQPIENVPGAIANRT